MTGRALLTAILLGSAIAGTRVMAQIAGAEPQQPGQRETGVSTPRACVGAVDQTPTSRCRD
jgi:hypothetical protein